MALDNSAGSSQKRPPAPWGKQLQWPRCRWCHLEIRNMSSEPPFIWEHVGTDNPKCEGRPNMAEPVPDIHEEPFMESAWEFVTRYRRLRRNFRELSQSRASAVRRMHDYQELADSLIAAFEARQGLTIGEPELIRAIEALRDYRRSQLSAGWR